MENLRVREIMLLCQTGMSEYDPFEKVKIEACELNKRTVSALIRSLCPLDYENEKNDTVLQQKRFHTIIQVLNQTKLINNFLFIC